MFRSCLLLILLLGLAQSGQAQLSLPSKSDFEGPLRPFFTAGYQNTVLFDKSVRFIELQGGLEWNKRLRLGAEHQWLATQLRLRNDRGQSPSVSLRLYGLHSEYTFFINQRWGLSATMAMGWGSVDKAAEAEGLAYASPGGRVLYRFVPFMGLGATMGYRLMVGSQSDLSSLSGFTVATSIKVFPVELIAFIKSGELGSD